MTILFICTFFFSLSIFFKISSYLQKYYETDLIGRLPKDHRGVVRVLVPLCGKSNDMKWLFLIKISFDISIGRLAERGCSVLGVEFAEKAILEFFQVSKIAFEKRVVDDRPVYSSTVTDMNICIVQSDFYAVPRFDPVSPNHKFTDFQFPSTRREHGLHLGSGEYGCDRRRRSKKVRGQMFPTFTSSTFVRYSDILLKALKPRSPILMCVVDYDGRRYGGECFCFQFQHTE